MVTENATQNFRWINMGITETSLRTLEKAILTVNHALEINLIQANHANTCESHDECSL